jgi:hypothetical protein
MEPINIYKLNFNIFYNEMNNYTYYKAFEGGQDSYRVVEPIRMMIRHLNVCSVNSFTKCLFCVISQNDLCYWFRSETTRFQKHCSLPESVYFRDENEF